MSVIIKAYLVFQVHPQEVGDDDYAYFLDFYPKFFRLAGFDTVDASEAVEHHVSGQEILQRAALNLKFEHDSEISYVIYNLIQIVESMLRLYSSYYSLKTFEYEFE